MKKQALSITFLILVTFLFCLAIPPFLSAQTPIRWSAEGVIDNQCDKSFLLLSPVLQLVITVGFQFARNTDPRRKGVERLVSTCNVLLIVLCLSIFGICPITAISAQKLDALDVPVTITLESGFLFTVMDNLMPKVHQDYFIDVKIPWASEDENS